jgi:hypothetical protein
LSDLNNNDRSRSLFIALAVWSLAMESFSEGPMGQGIYHKLNAEKVGVHLTNKQTRGASSVLLCCDPCVAALILHAYEHILVH